MGVQKGQKAVYNLSGRADLNRRPHRPERCALAKLRYAPKAMCSLPHPVGLDKGKFCGTVSLSYCTQGKYHDFKTTCVFSQNVYR